MCICSNPQNKVIPTLNLSRHPKMLPKITSLGNFGNSLVLFWCALNWKGQLLHLEVMSQYGHLDALSQCG